MGPGFRCGFSGPEAAPPTSVFAVAGGPTMAGVSALASTATTADIAAWAAVAIPVLAAIGLIEVSAPPVRVRAKRRPWGIWVGSSSHFCDTVA